MWLSPTGKASSRTERGTNKGSGLQKSRKLNRRYTAWASCKPASPQDPKTQHKTTTNASTSCNLPVAQPAPSHLHHPSDHPQTTTRSTTILPPHSVPLCLPPQQTAALAAGRVDTADRLVGGQDVQRGAAASEQHTRSCLLGPSHPTPFHPIPTPFPLYSALRSYHSSSVLTVMRLSSSRGKMRRRLQARSRDWKMVRFS